YPFIDEETKTILDSLMEGSSSYYDFVQLLCDTVLENEVPENLAYIAAVQAWWCRLDKAIEDIRKRYDDVPRMKPWGYLHSTAEIDQVRYHDSVVEDIEQVMRSSPEDWILTELHLLHAHYHWPMFGDIPSLLEPVERARELMAANPLLECFEAQACWYEAWANRIEGDMKTAIDIYQRGIELAETHNDYIHLCMNLGGKGDAQKNVSIQDAMASFEASYVVTQDLKVPYLEAEVCHDSGVVFETAGEYDLALSSFHEAWKVQGFTVLPALSRVYARLGDGQQALEYAQSYMDSLGQDEILGGYLVRAIALAELDRVAEAERDLVKVYPLVMQRGLDRVLGRYYIASGIVERARGDYLAASDSFEKALDIFEQVGDVRGEKSRALLGLAKAEILLAEKSASGEKSITPGTWLCRAEKHAVDNDFPGIRMQVALLKAEFYQSHGQLKDALGTLQEGLKITDSLGVESLRRRIHSRIREVKQLILDEEIVS
ncbi:MAG: tetratricopeptide repeat protein, partial [Promethearchaeota archaeon]